MGFLSGILGIAALIIFIYFIYCGYKWFKYRSSSQLKHQYKKKFWISLLVYFVLAMVASIASPTDNNNQSNHSKAIATYHNTGNAKQNFEYFKNHGVHKFGDYSTNHPYKPSDGPEDTTTAMGAHWSNAGDDFIINTDANSDSDSDKHVQAEACFHQFKKFIQHYKPMKNKNWDGTVEFQDDSGGQITTGNINYKHLSENGMGFDD